MKKTFLLSLFLLSVTALMARDVQVSSPDGRLVLTVSCDNGAASYAITYDGRQMLKPSALGLKANYGDFARGLKMSGDVVVGNRKGHYTMTRTKVSNIAYDAKWAEISFKNADENEMMVTFWVANNDVAYRYTLSRPAKGNPKCAVILEEESSFNLPEAATTFLCPQAKPMSGWERTKPSYEEEYTPDAPLAAKSQYGVGYTFPCLFRIGDEGWLLLSETGTTSDYCGCRLSDYQPGKGYTITFPQEGENNGMGSAQPAIMLPGSTPWRTITLGKSLKPIVETTVQFDVVEPLYEPCADYKPGRYTWSWLVWQDASCNYDDQKAMIDLASAMGYEYVLVDALWDEQIGYDKIEELSRYAQGKQVHLLLWYNSNGAANDAPQGPRGVMNNTVRRRLEMAWMRRNGIKGIKVDFFGGDKQETMKLYEDILSDANDYGLQVIFHGCTIPRGWERMYPNYVASEGALASENVDFTDYHARREAFEMTMHPFSRNAIGSFDWGGVMMNRHFSRDNRSRHQRYTSDVFEMATAITNQTSVNCVAMYPNNLEELPQFELDFLRNLPTTWDETLFLEGYPTRYVALARRTGSRWYVAGLNAEAQPKTLTLSLPMLAGQTVRYYTDRPKGKGDLVAPSVLKTLKIDKNGRAKVIVQPNGGFILCR